MARPLLTDELWNAVEPILPAPHARRFRFPGRKPIDNRVSLSGILFVLKTGIPWEDLPAEMGCCGMTCWRRLAAWQASGIWEKIHRVFLERLNEADQIDWERAVIDSSLIRAVGGGAKLDPIPPTGGNWAASTI